MIQICSSGYAPKPFGAGNQTLVYLLWFRESPRPVILHPADPEPSVVLFGGLPSAHLSQTPSLLC